MGAREEAGEESQSGRLAGDGWSLIVSTSLGHTKRYLKFLRKLLGPNLENALFRVKIMVDLPRHNPPLQKPQQKKEK
jgi:hypothetical protein